MRSLRTFLVAWLAFALPLAALALTNQDIIKMQKAGLSADTILLSIQKEPVDFDTGPDALIELRAAGVPDRVIQKMIDPSSSAQSAPVESYQAPQPPVTSPVGFHQDFPSIAPPLVNPVVGQDYFTRYTFHEEKNNHVTTNYARGPAVPVNTPVKLVSMSGSKLVISRTDTGQAITVENVEKHTNKTINEVARLLLSSEKTPLEKLPEEVANAVRAGEMRKGMTKELVLMARGYPPAHETPSIEGDKWVYWSSRFVKHTVIFSGGRLSEGRGLY